MASASEPPAAAGSTPVPAASDPPAGSREPARFDTPPAERLLVYRLAVPVRRGDMDAVGHVNNTVYFRFMESARIDWFDSLGCAPGGGAEGWSLMNAACTFRRQFEYPDTVIVSVYLAGVGRSSVDTWTEMASASDPDTPRAFGPARLVWADRAEQRSRPIPDALRAALRRPWQGR